MKLTNESELEQGCSKARSRFISRRSSNSGVIENELKNSLKENLDINKPMQKEENNKKEDMAQAKEKLIKNNKQYWEKRKVIPPTTNDNYKFVKLIGKGAFGKVMLGIHRLTGKYVAIKIIEKSHMKDEFSRKKVFREVYILKKIRHANVIRLLEVFESDKDLHIVMEYAGCGDLLHYIRKNKCLSEQMLIS